VACRREEGNQLFRSQ